MQLILEAVKELPFAVGKGTLTDILLGKKNSTIRKHKLDKLSCYGSCAYSVPECRNQIQQALSHGFLKENRVGYYRTLEITSAGIEELANPQDRSLVIPESVQVTKAHKTLFAKLPFLEKYNDEQKLAIITQSPHSIVIAGAGSGKTTVLTKRIEFLTQYQSVDASTILAITFTRKAKEEMLSRIRVPVRIETFNSFCEQILRDNESLIYDRPVRMVTYQEKRRLVTEALRSNGYTIHTAVHQYFTIGQRRGKTEEELYTLFSHDVFNLRHCTFDHALMRKVCDSVNDRMRELGLRDFSDQIRDVIRYFKQSENVPKYTHVLVDEYQDVNNEQVELLTLLQSDNLFCVGDPRQSIYGWRGSEINHILGSDAEYIQLKHNYRSTDTIVGLANRLIKPLGLTDLQANKTGVKPRYVKFPGKDRMLEYIKDEIVKSSNRGQIFVLGRTNRDIDEMAECLRASKIAYSIKTEDSVNMHLGTVTLATVHGIKGMEADTVFVLGDNFPVRSQERPIEPYVYDKEAEERRILYVALTRARHNLMVTYTNNLSYLFPAL